MSGVSAVRLLAGVLVVLAGVALLVVPGYAPLVIAVGLAGSIGPLVEAWKGAKNTALRGAILWAAAALAIGLGAELAWWIDSQSAGRVVAGHLTYLSTLAALAGLVSVLGARTPGAVAWALLMGVLVLVMLIPWLEEPTLLRHAGGMGRLRLDAPWSLFYALLVVAGVTNYLPTRYGPAALWLAAGFLLEYLGLARSDWPPGRRALVWAAVPWTYMAATWVAYARAVRRRASAARPGLESLWLWFRDHWGVVWALRVQERFNRAADAAGWPIRLTWFGVALLSPGAAPPEAAATTLKTLIRRFASSARLDQEETGGRP
jgi:hypothetical protein